VQQLTTRRDDFILCAGCKTPIARLREDHIEIQQKHHGARHITRVRVARQ
jgi:hypothetical protein